MTGTWKGDWLWVSVRVSVWVRARVRVRLDFWFLLELGVAHRSLETCNIIIK